MKINREEKQKNVKDFMELRPRKMRLEKKGDMNGEEK